MTAEDYYKKFYHMDEYSPVEGNDQIEYIQCMQGYAEYRDGEWQKLINTCTEDTRKLEVELRFAKRDSKTFKEKWEEKCSTVANLADDIEKKDEEILNLIKEKDKQNAEINVRDIAIKGYKKIIQDKQNDFKELLYACMIINNLSAEERLGWIRREYKEIYNKLRAEAEKI